MHFNGQEQFEIDQQTLWDRLTDMNFISSLIPDRERTEEIGDRRFSCRVRPSLGFFKGSLRLAFDIVDSQPTDQLAVRVVGKGIGASVTVNVSMRLAAADVGSTLDWEAVVAERRGLLKPISIDLIQGAAERVISDFWGSFRGAI
jgi:carbon monoxide dehydrogenase subunit G